ncbi:MAG: hypothetical protein L3K10_08445 [Thermoplasmata archaeon]|nr:hypothetical protein [Thermoplasmata archaeon]
MRAQHEVAGARRHPVPDGWGSAALVVAVVMIQLTTLLLAANGVSVPVTSRVVSANAARLHENSPTESSILSEAQGSLASSGPHSGSPVSPPARIGGVMANDPPCTALLFGGHNNTTWFNDTWVWSKCTPGAPGFWSHLSPRHSPPAGMDLAMTYDSSVQCPVLVDGAQTWLFLAVFHDWALNGGSSPPAREGSGFADNVRDGYSVLFGGHNTTGGFLNDTWKFHLGHWTQIHPPTLPEGRAFAGMAWDAADGYVVLFGGCQGQWPCSTGGFLNGTWKFADGTWAKLSPAVSPSPRAGAVMAQLETTRGVLLFGGSNHPGWSRSFNDTWTFLAGVWTKSAASPSSLTGRSLAMISFNPKQGWVLLFGGAGPLSTPLNDTWKIRGGGWGEQ